ncbi:hypothetical protein M427DRAFT_56684 [Gonapodya prolifera JEL478]|uniref:F-box domain-containing protein n=1 Tax=Gonapodya prolifera (strain JEL478) TaxID=1344416 RepID=A0A139AGN9_GONPJ|nr:hypothetical protein M427DRAFT_56684 [Gonapodya prolifera JEL478]|eukprot:KXS15615.1 hypothetical protein M427DRAFT_56684 [Gonapodya prolifera JEL478]
MSSSKHTQLLHLPLETLQRILSHLATDFLVTLSQTSRAARSVVVDLPTWTNHHLTVEVRKLTSSRFESAIRRAITAPRWIVFNNDAPAFIRNATSINLDRIYLPIDVSLILHILDTFTSLRDASFIGCLKSGMNFVRAAPTTPGRAAPWAQHLKRLDLSDSECGS